MKESGRVTWLVKGLPPEQKWWVLQKMLRLQTI